MESELRLATRVPPYFALKSDIEAVKQQHRSHSRWCVEAFPFINYMRQSRLKECFESFFGIFFPMFVDTYFFELSIGRNKYIILINRWSKLK